MLAVRKQELTAAKKEEFDLEAAIWYLPKERTKTEAAIAIPLPKQAVEALQDLFRMSGHSDYLRPAIKAQDRMLPHIHEGTLNVALSKVKKNMPDVETFCIHDLRRTARTQLSALGVQSHIAERCLNHKLKGIEGRYDTYDFFDERKGALQLLANCLESLESGNPVNVIPIRKQKRA